MIRVVASSNCMLTSLTSNRIDCKKEGLKKFQLVEKWLKNGIKMVEYEGKNGRKTV